MKLDILIGIKHFIQIIKMTNLAIHTKIVPFQISLLHLVKFLTKSHGVIYKKSKNFSEKEGNERKDKKTVIKKKKKIVSAKFKLLKKNWVI